MIFQREEANEFWEHESILHEANCSISCSDCSRSRGEEEEKDNFYAAELGD